MNIHEIKKLLRNIKQERIKISNKIEFKINKVHRVNINKVFKNLTNPELLIYVEKQP